MEGNDNLLSINKQEAMDLVIWLAGELDRDYPQMIHKIEEKNKAYTVFKRLVEFCREQGDE